MAQKSYLKPIEVKPATKVLSIRIQESLHSRITAVTTLASSSDREFDLTEIVAEHLTRVVDAIEKELAGTKPPVASVVVQAAAPQIIIDNITPDDVEDYLETGWEP